MLKQNDDTKLVISVTKLETTELVASNKVYVIINKFAYQLGITLKKELKKVTNKSSENVLYPINYQASDEQLLQQLKDL